MIIEMNGRLLFHPEISMMSIVYSDMLPSFFGNGCVTQSQRSSFGARKAKSVSRCCLHFLLGSLFQTSISAAQDSLCCNGSIKVCNAFPPLGFSLMFRTLLSPRLVDRVEISTNNHASSFGTATLERRVDIQPLLCRGALGRIQADESYVFVAHLEHLPVASLLHTIPPQHSFALFKGRDPYALPVSPYFLCAGVVITLPSKFSDGMIPDSVES